MTPTEIALLITAVVTAIITWRKFKPDVAKTNADEKKARADALDIATDAAGKVSEMFTKAMNEIEDLREHQRQQDEAIDELKKALKQATRERNAAFNWAARLIKQMKEIKPEIEPVEYLPPLDTESSIQAIKMGKKSGDGQ